MKRFGLLGEHLSHSYSPQIHAHFGRYAYPLYEKSPEEVESFFLHDSFDGLNVTIPYKKTVLPLCSRVSETARRIGSVNTVVRESDGSLSGYNTDYSGFSFLLDSSGIEVRGKKVLVLGSGGASVTVQAVLEDRGALPVVISRSGENNYENLEKHGDAGVVVNTTPVGMFPDTGRAPLSVAQFPALSGVLDLIYNPARTQLLLDAAARNIPCANGLAMLVAQAKKSAELFLRASVPEKEARGVLKALEKEMQNVILVGMPGCGKSTVGKALAKSMKRTFVDADEEFTAAYGIVPADLIVARGEGIFRNMESALLRRLCSRSSLVIATGGGAVTRRENYDILHQNGTVVWLKRDIDLLATEGRPLSLNLERMLMQREPMYDHFSDFAVENEGKKEETVKRIEALL